MEEESETIDRDAVFFNRKYGKEFFLISTFDEFDRRSVRFLCKVMKLLKEKYVKAGCLIFVPFPDMKSVGRVIGNHDMEETIFVEPMRGTMESVYRGARIYLNITKEDNSHAHIQQAFLAGLPVITIETDFFTSVFADTPYAEYVIPDRDEELFAKAIDHLFQDNFVYTDYKTNTKLLIQKMSERK